MSSATARRRSCWARRARRSAPSVRRRGRSWRRSSSSRCTCSCSSRCVTIGATTPTATAKWALSSPLRGETLALMEWRDDGIVLGIRRHGETSAILEVMTRAHGRHLGLVRGGRSRKQQPVLQPGNRVDLIWRARLDEHLGTFQVEAIEMNAARLMDSAVAVYGLQTMATHLRLLPERDAHEGLYETLAVMIAHLDDVDAAGELVARFELLVLDELGFGLDLSQCAATGTRQDLAYVSPKSG